MIVGRKDVFAIDCQPVETVDGWVFGRFLFWAKEQMIGDPDGATDLKGCARWLRDFVSVPRDRFDTVLRGKSPCEIARLLYHPVMSSGANHEPLPDAFSRFHISHVGMSSFDRFDVLLVEDPDVGQRLIWRQDDGQWNDVLLPVGEMQTVGRACLKWMANQGLVGE